MTVGASEVHRSDPITSPAGPWWRRTGLDSIGGRLVIAGSDAEALGREHGTPLFVYDRRRLAENADRLASALTRAGLRHRLRSASTWAGRQLLARHLQVRAGARRVPRGRCRPNRAGDGRRPHQRVGDLFAEDYDLPPVAEGDIVALLNAGGNHQAMSSTHCLRPHAEALFLDL